MLPTINLDNENYIDIFEKARKMIPRVYPEWTDYNEHDPGITLLELFSWLKEMQHFYIDQIGRENYRMFLKLLGICPRKKMPARSLLEVTGFGEDEKTLLRGMKFKAGDLTFETESMETLEKNKILGCLVHSEKNDFFYNEEMINSKSAMSIPVFGALPETGDIFDIYFEKSFEKNVIHKIYLEIEDDYAVNRNTIDPDFYPLAETEWQYLGVDGFRKCVYVEDGTKGFLTSGSCSFIIDDDMMEEDGKYVIRVLLKRAEYDVNPRIKKISFNIFPICQTDTRIDHVIRQPGDDNGVFIDAQLCAMETSFVKVFLMEGCQLKELSEAKIEKDKTGTKITLPQKCDTVMIVYGDEKLQAYKCFDTNGFPEQSYQIDDKELLYSGFDIMIREKSDGCYHLWEKTEDFHCSEKKDRHYIFNEETGVITFGDCEHGMAPEGSVEIIRYITSAGVKGNIKKAKIEHTADGERMITATNCYDVSSGQIKESLENAFERFSFEQNKIERGVTLADYEEIVKQTPGLRIRKVKAIAGFDKDSGDEITVVVQPYSYKEKAGLSRAYYTNIYQNLEKKRLIGTKVRILPPEYYGATVFVEASVLPYYTDAKQRIENVIREYFEKVVSAFGSSIIYSDIFGRVDALKCISHIRSFSISIQGKDVVYTKNENIIIPQNGLTFVKSIECEVTSADY